MKVYRWVTVVLSGLGLFLSSWIVIPAPNLLLLPLAVGAPEISPLLLLGNAFLLGIALLQDRRYVLNRVAIGSSIFAMLLGSLPLLQIPATLQQANTQMQSAFGANYLQISAAEKAQMRPAPVRLTDLVTGLPVSTIQPDCARPCVQRHHESLSDGTRLSLEIYQPLTTASHPAIVTIYGGAWQRGSPEQNAAFNAYMAAQGYTVVAVDYRHAPRYHFPTQIEDIQTGLRWIGQNAATYNIDLNRVALMGWSAGAHLALLAAYQSEIIPIRAVISYYGPTDLAAGYRDPPRPDPINTRAVLEAFLGGSPDQLPQPYELASPIHSVRAGLPPTLLIYGKRDHIVKPIFGQQLYDKLHLTGNKAVLISIPWAEHAFDAVFRGLGNQMALYYTERFLALVMN
jgi:acetyl esterase/lipase